MAKETTPGRERRAATWTERGMHREQAPTTPRSADRPWPTDVRMTQGRHSHFGHEQAR